MLLSRHEWERLQNQPQELCAACGEHLRKNYCRDCDEFFWEGHANTCRRQSAPTHAFHRTYKEALDGGLVPGTMEAILSEAKHRYTM